MLLVWYKREFEWADVLRLWESLWTDFLSSNFHLFIALAILEKHRDVILEHLKHFDEVLKYGTFSNTSQILYPGGLRSNHLGICWVIAKGPRAIRTQAARIWR